MQNWAATFTFTASRVHHPGTVEEVRELVAGLDQVKAVGTRHSFHPLADSPTDLISLDELATGPGAIRIDTDSVTVRGAVTYGALAQALQPAGLALRNLASLPHISVIGAVATATHGSGDGNQNLAAAVRALDLVSADGSLHTLRRGEDGFDGAVVGLGALGIVTAVTLDVVPSFAVAQTVYEQLPLATALDHFDDITALGYSVSLFTDWRTDRVNQVWVKALGAAPADVFGAAPADGPRNPVPGAPAVNTTTQLGQPGAWADRLPHFRMEFTPSAGEEIQSEYLVPREHAGAALRAVSQLSARIAPLLQICEVRTIAADELWLSTAYRQDSVGIHFTWLKRTAEVTALLPAIEAALAPFHPRPHWGKVFRTAPAEVQARYPRLADFRDLAAGFDPQRKFGNKFLADYIYS